jgi:TP901 family phage tail tape measure protein
MAAKNHNITLNLDFNVEKSKLQEISSLINKDLGKGIASGKGESYFNNISSSISQVTKEAAQLYKMLGKPLVSQSQAKNLGTALESVFDKLDDKLLSFQGNVAKSFNSINNVDALKKIRVLGNEINKMVSDYQKISQLNSQVKGSGNKAEINKQINSASKELTSLSKKEGALTKTEIKRQNELNKIIEEGNKKLQEKLELQERINALLQANQVGSAGELKGKIDDTILEQNNLTDASLSQDDFNTLKTVLIEVRALLSELRTASRNSTVEIVDDFNEQKEAMVKAEQQAQTFNTILKSLGINLSLDWVVQKLKEVVRYSYDYIKNLDAALTEISVVSNKTREEVLGLTSTFIELSAKTGMAIDDIAQASTLFYQQGLDDAAVKKMTEWTALFAKISNETVPVAADQLTSAINGFGYSVEKVDEVVDKMSVLAAYSAADINELATAMSKGASAASQAGLSFDQYNAYLATMIETTREAPENIGTSLKTIMARFQQVKTEGSSDDGETDVNAVETALKSVGIQLRDSQNQLRDLGDVLDELGPKWSSLDRNTQAYLGTVIAGTRQQSRFISLMQNWDRALELTEASENSAGAATRMHAKAMDGLDASLNNLTNAWQELISALADGDTIKFWVDALTSVVKWFGDGNTLLKIFTIAMTAFNIKTLATNISLTKQGEKYKNLNTVVGNTADAISGLIKTTGALGTEMSKESILIEEQNNKYREQIRLLTELITKKSQAAGAPVPGEVGTTTTAGTAGANVVKEGADVVDNISDDIKKADKKVGGFGTKLKTIGKNAVSMIGSIQLGINAALIAISAIEGLFDLFTTSPEEMMSKATEAYEKTQEEIDKYKDLIITVESSGKVYDTLSKKMNKSTQEVEQLADATEQLAKAVPSAIIGYDQNGNAIIDMNKARNEADKAETKLVEEAKNQIGNIGALALAELHTKAEENYANSKAGKVTSGFSTGGKIAAGVGIAGAVGTLAAVGAANFWNPVGWASLITAGVGAVAWGVSELVESFGEDAERLELLNKVHEEVFSAENMQKILENMSLITNASISDSTVGGVSEANRTTMANYLGNSWINNQINDLDNQLLNKTIDEDEYKEKVEQLGNEWQKVLDRINDDQLAKSYLNINKVAEGIGDKTYSSVETAIEDIITNDMGISSTDPLFETLKDAFFDAAYSGIDSSIHATMEELKTRREALKNEGKSTAEYDQAIGAASAMSSNELGVYSSIGVTDNVNLFNSMVSQYGDRIREALVGGTQNATAQAIAILAQYRDQAENELLKAFGTSNYLEIDYSSLTTEQQAVYDKWVNQAKTAVSGIEAAWGQLEKSYDKTWKVLLEEYDQIVERTETVRNTLSSLTSGDGIDYDQWKSFVSLLDEVDLEAFNTEQVEAYADAIQKVSENLYVENGMLYANADAISSVADLEESLADIQLEATKQQLINKRTELETAKAVIDAQIAQIKYQIAVATNSSKASSLKTQAEQAWITASNQMNQVFNTNNAKVTEAMVGQYANAFASIGEKFNAMITGMNNGTVDTALLKKEYQAMIDKLNFDSYEDEIKDYGLDELYSMLDAAEKLSASYSFQISNINLKIANLNSGIKKTTEGVKSASEAMDEYITKLEKFLNILRHIEREEANLSISETLEDMKTGAGVIDEINKQLEYTEHLIDDMTTLYQNYEKEANEAAKEIRKGFGDIVKFDKWGNYEVDMTKYNKLSDEEKKMLDESLSGYDDIIDKRDEAYKKSLDYIKKERDLNQKKIDKYIEAEDELVEAIKQREEKILDYKLKAIDKEIEAIEKAAEARRKAREEDKEAEELSSLQTDLQRALMDSSGASATQVLEIQKQIKDKQREIADNSFDTMVDDMKTQLEEEKEMEQALFDERLEEMDWYWDEVDRIMAEGTEAVTETLTTYLDSYNQASEIQQTELLNGWTDTFEQAMEIGKTGAQNLQKIVKDMQADINKMQVDEDIITDDTINTGFVKRPETEKKDSGSGSSSSSGGGSSKKTYTNTNNQNTKKQNNTVQPYGITLDNGYNLCTYKSVEPGKSIVLPTETRSGYTFNGWSIPSRGTVIGGGKTFYPTKSETITAQWTKKNNSGTSNKPNSGLGYSYPPLIVGNGRFAKGGMAYYTGPAWLDGTRQHPEAVLNAMQTKAFLSFTDDLAALRAEGGLSTSSVVTIDSISFNVESMSSVADGERAFDAFVDKFKEIGAKQGISILGTANRN